MTFDVFISYSQKDASAANAVCHAVEAHGIRCWIAPRDVPAGQGWKGSIVDAIRHARVVVLIFSAEVNESKQVRREVDIAFEAGRAILPFRIENVEMGDDLYYCLADRHWLDAITPPIEQHIGSLVQALRGLLGDAPAPAPEATATPPIRPPEEPAPLGPAAWVPTQPPPVPEPAPAPPVSRASVRGGWRPSQKIGWIGAAVAGVALVVLAISLGWVGHPSTATLTTQGMAAVEAKRYADALPLLQSAANAGSADAQGTLGRLYANGWGVTPDFAQARKWFELSAGQGNSIGYSGLGFLYLTGKGVAKDSARALEMLHKAADLNDPRAMANLAYVYEIGDGVPKDPSEARRLYEKAAAMSNSYARLALGRLATANGNTPQADAEAIKWYRVVADKGEPEGACGLGVLYATERASVRSYPEALKWYRVAADQKAPCGEYGLGTLYWYGHGVAANYDEAMRWFEQAAAHGDADARDFIVSSQDDWVLKPLFVGAWRPIAGDERRTELARLKQEARLEGLGSTDFRRLRSLDLTFYPNAKLYELEVGRSAGSFGVFTYIRQGDTFVRIDGKSPQIHQLSRTAPIKIDTLQQAVAFLRFFMGAIQGVDGVFMVVDDPGDVPWLPSTNTAQQKSIENRIQRLTVEASASGGWRAKATVRYRDALFIANIWIKPDGMVQMLDDNPVASDLPIQIDRFDDQGVRVRVNK